ncbi:MAG: hypothetical protein QFX33_02285 [Candidatus Nezhaarchaeota archaeon]|nr:hypothetical protein [Candidatus Nezhaarchaeota archaeon]
MASGRTSFNQFKSRGGFAGCRLKARGSPASSGIDEVVLLVLRFNEFTAALLGCLGKGDFGAS